VKTKQDRYGVPKRALRVTLEWLWDEAIERLKKKGYEREGLWLEKGWGPRAGWIEMLWFKERGR